MITPAQDRALRNLVAKYPDHPMAKFCIRPMSWYAIADRIAEEMGLHERTGKRILDIGCGFGYFVKAWHDRGHDVTGLDLPGGIIQEANRILEVPFVPYRIVGGHPLPDGMQAFDLVTTFGVNFKYDSDVYWGREEYQSLSHDVRGRLNRGGSWILRPNQTDDPDHPVANLMRAEWWATVAPEATITITHNQVEIRWT